MQLTLPSIYPITDTRLSGLTHSEQVERLAGAGACLIQFREKESDSGEFCDQARLAVLAARNKGVKLIINDRVDIAILAEADGVHIGQTDLPPAAARKLLGPDAIIGFSTHDLDQVREALTLPVDYVAFGPVFSTTTKADPDPVTGLAMLAEAKNILGGKPLVAIGGINEKDIEDVLAAGANSVAVIGALYEPPSSIEQNFARLNGKAGQRNRDQRL